MNNPPLNLDEAQKFSCCQPYTDYHICIYAGGGSQYEHDMYWAFIIYDRDGVRYHHGHLPYTCLDADDGMSYCREIIDKWNRGITYEDIYLWRAICEYLWCIKDKDAYHDPTYPDYINQVIKGCLYLIGTDRTHRQTLWDLYKIQLIKWQKPSKHHEGWCLKGNWEDKIWFLEQVYVLGKKPDELPRPWIEKWNRKQEQEKFKAIDRRLKIILFGLECLQRSIEWNLGAEQIRDNLNGIAAECKEAREAIALLFMDLTQDT